MSRLAILGGLALAGLLPQITASNYVLGIAVSACMFTVGGGVAQSGLRVYRHAVVRPGRVLGIGGYCSAPDRDGVRGNFWHGLGLAAAGEWRAGRGGGLSGAAPQSPCLRDRIAELRAAHQPGRPRLGRADPRAARHPGLPPPSLLGFLFRGTASFYYLALAYAMLALACSMR
ncbi:MAG: hypothetical protein WDO24_23980 [Pseudomonadota bacterium]